MLLLCLIVSVYLKKIQELLHYPHEISMVGRTGQDAQRKQKPNLTFFIHKSNKSVSNKQENVPIKCSKLLCLIFFSKS